jgi:Holliday junction resolvase RusA-like endonuclease
MPTTYLLSIKGNKFPSKKNSKQVLWNKKIGKPFISVSEDYKVWHKHASLQANVWKGATKLSFPLTRLKLTVKWYFDSKHNRDLDNLLGSVNDMLKDCGIISDDSWKVLRPITLDADYSDTTPRIEIYLTPIEE